MEKLIYFLVCIIVGILLILYYRKLYSNKDNIELIKYCENCKHISKERDIYMISIFLILFLLLRFPYHFFGSIITFFISLAFPQMFIKREYNDEVYKLKKEVYRKYVIVSFIIMVTLSIIQILFLFK